MKPARMLCGLVVAAALSVPAYAQQQQQRGSQDARSGRQQQSRQQQQQQQSMTRPNFRISGQITHMREVTIDGERHLLALLRTQNGRRAVLDLGDTNLPHLGVRRGEPITALGGAGRIDGEPVLVVDRLRTHGGRTLTIARGEQADRFQQMTRGQQPSQFGQQPRYMTDVRGIDGAGRRATRQQQQQQQAGAVVFVTGRVVQMRTGQITGDRQPHVIAMIRTRTGRNITADLGAEERLGDIDIQRGELISVLGTPGRVNGRSAVIANAVADVNVVRSFHGVQRSAARQQEQQQRWWQESQRPQGQQRQQRQQDQRQTDPGAWGQQL